MLQMNESTKIPKDIVLEVENGDTCSNVSTPIILFNKK